MDPRLNYPAVPVLSANKQVLQNVSTRTLEPISKVGNSYEFEIASNSIVLFGPETGFYITGSFQGKAEGSTEFETIPLTDYQLVKVQPNWLEHCIKSIDVFHHHSNTRPHETPPFVEAFLNTYLSAVMDKFQKKYLFYESSSPGNGVPVTKDGWTLTANSEWHKYSKTVFGEDSISFNYIPLHLFPFFQGPNFIMEGPLNGIPMQGLGKLAVRLNFKDSFDHIFRKLATNNKSYTFNLESVTLKYDEAHLSPAYEKQFLNTKRMLNFSGVTKFGLTENIPAQVQSHRCRFQDILMPEGIFIFALPSSVVGGQYKYSEDTNDAIFMNHNVTKVELSFGGLPFFLKSPNIGDVTNDLIEKKSVRDHMEQPPFGLWQDPDHLNFNTLVDGGINTAYPHIYVNLTLGGKDKRIVPIGDDGSILKTSNDLDIVLTFGSGGATDKTTYFIYIFYSDINMILDMKNQRFFPYYKRARSFN